MMNIESFGHQLQPYAAQVMARTRKGRAAHQSYKALRERLRSTFLCGCLQAELARGGTKAVPHFLKLLGDRHERVRESAATMLGHICEKRMRESLCRRRVAPALFRRAVDRSPHVRVAIADALGDMKHRAAIPTLLRMGRDRNLAVQKAALEALCEIGRADPSETDEDLKIESARRARSEMYARALASMIESALYYLYACVRRATWFLGDGE